MIWALCLAVCPWARQLLAHLCLPLLFTVFRARPVSPKVSVQHLARGGSADGSWGLQSRLHCCGALGARLRPCRLIALWGPVEGVGARDP